MSQLWRDQIRIFVAPERVDLVRISRSLKGLGRFVQAPRITHSCVRDPDQSIWEAPLQKFEQLMKDATDTEVMITLSNHFIRYVTLPPQAEITKPSEVNAYATFRMREVYGERADKWKLSVSAWDPFGGAICAAIDHDLMARFEEIATLYRIKLKDVEPYLASTFDHWKRLLCGPRVYFALVETGRICIALLIDGVWQNIRNQRILHCVEDELLAALDQVAILSGHKKIVEQVHLFAPENPGLALPVVSGWRIIPLKTEKIPKLAHYPTPIVNSGEVKKCAA